MLVNPYSSILSVSALNQYIKSKLDEDPLLRSICVRGEISTFRRPSSGHLYFSIKDEKSRIKAVMFYRDAMHLSFSPKEGDEVLILGRISSYIENGEYQLYVQEMEPYGKGKQLIELEKLKKKLFAEGLFAEERKRPIPAYPQEIGIISAKGSAALADMVKNIHLRYPIVTIHFFPATVQGEKAPESLKKALLLAQKTKIDVLLLGRGGGANEDLSAFNDESFVRMLANFPVPVISAIGHEIDTTLADLVSDARVSTPTGAAIKATPDQEQIFLHLDQKEAQLERRMVEKIRYFKEKIENLSSRPCLISPLLTYQKQKEHLEHAKAILSQTLLYQLTRNQKYIEERKKEMHTSMRYLLERREEKLKMIEAHLEAINPNSVLQRGYSFITSEDGHIIESIDQIEIGQVIQTTMQNGTFYSKVESKEKKL